MSKRPQLVAYEYMTFRPLFPDRCDSKLIEIANERNAAANDFDSMSYDETDSDEFDFG